jgi:hypothetical protein
MHRLLLFTIQFIIDILKCHILIIHVCNEALKIKRDIITLMIDDISIDIEFEKKINAQFGFSGGISKILARNVPAGRSSVVTIFFSKTHRDLYAFLDFRSRATLSDVRKALLNMNLRPLSYIPPKGAEDYFDDIARSKFIKVFPGRRNIRSDELIYYRTLVPYNPALVQILEVKDGIIKTFDRDTHGNWRKAIALEYKKN